MHANLSTGNVSPKFDWRVIPIGSEWGEMFKVFEADAFRLETLQAYAEPSESSPFNQYRRGNIPSPDFLNDWCQLVREHAKAGHVMRRIHVVDLPLSDYMRFEVECCYRFSAAAGEEIRLLNRASLTPSLVRLAQEDFWLFDNGTVMMNDYDHTGALFQARLTSDPRALEYYSSIDRKLWALGVPFKVFYEEQTGTQV
jgi:hypothetical protein